MICDLQLRELRFEMYHTEIVAWPVPWYRICSHCSVVQCSLVYMYCIRWIGGLVKVNLA